MGKRNPVEELFFKFDHDSNKSKCLIEGCISAKNAVTLQYIYMGI